MFGPPLAFAQTYFVPSLRRTIGPAAAELDPLLRSVWADRVGSMPEPPGEIHDGVSVWLDQALAPHALLIAAHQVTTLDDPELLARVSAALRPHVAK